MRLRSPKVVRLRQFNQVKDPQEFFLSEIQLYMPFKNEPELEFDSLEHFYDKYNFAHSNHLRTQSCSKLGHGHLKHYFLYHNE